MAVLVLPSAERSSTVARLGKNILLVCLGNSIYMFVVKSSLSLYVGVAVCYNICKNTNWCVTERVLLYRCVRDLPSQQTHSGRHQSHVYVLFNEA